MSFILDALRKSENERRRDAPATLAHMPMARPRAGVPAWIWVVIVTLLAAVVVLAGAWWRTADHTIARGAGATEARGAVARDGQAGAAVPATPRVAAPPTADAQLDARALDSGAAPADLFALPSAADLRAAGIALPDLALQLVSWSTDPRERFAYINGYQYRQGQRVQNGPLVVSIEPQGVILEHDGRSFALRPQ